MPHIIQDLSDVLVVIEDLVKFWIKKKPDGDVTMNDWMYQK